MKMNKQEVLNIVDKKVREVALVFSQNSTALAREFTLQKAIKEITEGIESLLLKEEAKDDKPKPKGTKNL
jgi:hypothetical protein